MLEFPAQFYTVRQLCINSNVARENSWARNSKQKYGTVACKTYPKGMAWLAWFGWLELSKTPAQTPQGYSFALLIVVVELT